MTTTPPETIILAENDRFALHARPDREPFNARRGYRYRLVSSCGATSVPFRQFGKAARYAAHATTLARVDYRADRLTDTEIAKLATDTSAV